MEKKLKTRDIVLIVAMLLLVLVALYCVLRFIDAKLHPTTGTEPTQAGKTILRDGVEYYPRQDITVILLAGIDETGPVQDSGSYNNTGEADMVALVILDEETETIDVLALNRDTMLEMPILGIGGKEAGTKYGQLALAHTYGSGLADSAENLRTTISDFFYGLTIDYYVTVNMDTIALLNDAVGGVTVNVTEDFSQVDPTIPMGEVTLWGDQAVTFLRSRAGVGDQLNLTRMSRHETYMAAFVEALRVKLREDSSFALTTYETLADYMVTDISANALNGLVEFYSDYTMGQIRSIKGENVVNDYMEYHVDEAALDALILDLLYDPKK